jgi:hypothetical protein
MPLGTFVTSDKDVEDERLPPAGRTVNLRDEWRTYGGVDFTCACPVLARTGRPSAGNRRLCAKGQTRVSSSAHPTLTSARLCSILRPQ